MANKTLLAFCLIPTTFILAKTLSAQSVDLYPNAITDRMIHQETPMAVPVKIGRASCRERV